MNIDQVNKAIEEIKSKCDDDEVAHSLEDSLRNAFIQHVAHAGDPALAEMAKAVLSTNTINFSRWCA